MTDTYTQTLLKQITELHEIIEERDYEIEELKKAAGMSAGDVEIDAFRAGGLTPNEGVILACLYAAQGRTVSRLALDEVVPAIHSKDQDRDLGVFDVHVCKIRRKLGKDIVATIWGHVEGRRGGYAITATGMEWCDKQIALFTQTKDLKYGT
jgi:DNA-binding response OmpR family regulator